MLNIKKNVEDKINSKLIAGTICIKKMHAVTNIPTALPLLSVIGDLYRHVKSKTKINHKKIILVMRRKNTN